MPLLRIHDQKTWDAFVSTQSGAQFTQSFAWGEFQASQGIRMERVAWTDERGTWIAAAQCLYHKKNPLGGYTYVPRGPVIRHDALDRAADILDQMIHAMRREHVLDDGAIFLRLEPPLEIKRDPSPLPKTCRRSHAYQPASTLLINLLKSEEELLDAMHEKTRYNIRVAERKGVTVKKTDTNEALEIFLRLNEETAKRDRFVSRAPSHIRSTYLALRDAGMAQIRLAEKNGQTLAASMEIRYGDTVTYLYGASSSAERNAMAPYALHWDAIRSAKREGFRFYDLYGVNPENVSSPYYKKSWEGITRFKLGWGGGRVDFVGTWELPIRRLAYAILSLTRRVMGG